MSSVNRVSMYSVLAALLLIHITVLNHISIFGFKPDLILIAVAFFALFFGSGVGLEAGIVAGIGKDMLALDYMGVNTLVLGVTGLVIGAMRAKFFKESRWTRAMIVFFFSALSMSIHLFLYNIISNSSDINFINYAASPLLPVSLYSALAAIPLFSIMEGIFGCKAPQDIL
ncbi:MAG: rod shape-determining protein MreD [Candidatus Omnitrophota bacterium]